MNERNVAALTAALETAWAVTFQGVPIPVAELKEWRGFAPFLASSLAARGVLVPSALTDEQGYEVGSQVDFTTTRSTEREEIEARQVRAELERIAKGDG